MEFTLEHTFNVSPEKLYAAWLDSEQHSAMTDTVYKIEADHFTAWDGYISGKNLELVPGKYIKQAWRSTDFMRDKRDSILELTFEPAGTGTRLILKHSDLYKGDVEYKQGWIDYYFAPMEEYFGKV